MLSQNWKFPYTTDAVLNAAKLKVSFHQGRLDFWRKKESETMDRIRAEGIDVKTSLAGESYHTNAVFGAQVVINPTFQQDLNECHMKIQEHDDKVKTFAGWVQVLEAQRGDVTLELDHDDFLFFFGK